MNKVDADSKTVHLLMEEIKEKQEDPPKAEAAGEEKESSKAKDIEGFSFSSLYRLMGYSKRYISCFVIANICVTITAMTQTAIPWYCGMMLDEVNKKTGNIKEIALQFLIVCSINAVAGLIQQYFFKLAGQKIVLDIRGELFESLMSKEVNFFEQRKTGELISRLSSDTDDIQDASGICLSLLTRDILQFIGTLVMIFLISPKLTFILLVLLPISALLSLGVSKYGRKFWIEHQDAIAESLTVAEEAISNVRTVKAFACEKKEAKAYRSKLEKSYKIGKKKDFLWGCFHGVSSLLGNVSILLIFYFGGQMVYDNEISAGQLGSFVIYGIVIGTLASSVSSLMEDIVNSVAACEKVFGIMDLQQKMRTEGGEKPAAMSGDIRLDQVEFSYPSKEDVTVLKDFSLDIKNGEVVALVGSSGSGKSSIIGLIERFYDPKGGSISIDGYNLKDLDLSWVHRNIGYVSQEPSLFSGTIEENITYGVEDYTKEQLDATARMAYAYDFIHNKEMFPEGYQTVVGEKGIQLSGGQKQRVAIARALMKNPPVLIFDEATSALDAESEHQVQSAIEGIMRAGNKTMIIIAHRLSTIISCKRILMLNSGKIVEEGSHEELLSRNGAYKALIERQIGSLSTK